MLIKAPVSLFTFIMRHGDKKYNATHKTFGNYSVKKDLAYIDDGDPAHLLDVMYPVEGHDNGITLFYIHGGAYVCGSKDTTRVFTSWFVDKGFKVVSVNYRYIDKKNDIDITDQVSDVFAALQYIVDNAVALGINLDRFCLTGDSAGGHLSLLLDIIFHSEEARLYYGIEKLPEFEPKCVAVNSTMYDFESLMPMAKRFLTKGGIKKIFGKHCFEENFMKRNSPRTYVQNGVRLSPIFASTAYHDFFNMQSIVFHKDAIKYKLTMEYLHEITSRKEIGHVYNHFVFEDEGLKCNNMMVDFFEKYCPKIEKEENE